MGKSEGIMNSMLRFSLLVMIPVAVVAYSSGSSYASGSSASPTPAPTPAPTAGKVTAHVISSTVSLAGVTVAMFTKDTKAGKAARKAFQNTVASSLELCGAAGTSQCTGDDVVIVSVTAARRAGAKIDFYVKVKDAAKAAAGATTLNTFLKSTDPKTGFAAKLVAEAKKDPDAKATLGAVDPTTITVTVVKAPTASTNQSLRGRARCDTFARQLGVPGPGSAPVSNQRKGACGTNIFMCNENGSERRRPCVIVGPTFAAKAANDRTHESKIQGQWYQIVGALRQNDAASWNQHFRQRQ